MRVLSLVDFTHWLSLLKSDSRPSQPLLTCCWLTPQGPRARWPRDGASQASYPSPTCPSASPSLANSNSPSCVCVLSHFTRVWLCDPKDCGLPGSSVHGIFQTRILEWAAMILLQGIFLAQRLNLCLLCLLQCRRWTGEAPALLYTWPALTDPLCLGWDITSRRPSLLEALSGPVPPSPGQVSGASVWSSSISTALLWPLHTSVPHTQGAEDRNSGQVSFHLPLTHHLLCTQHCSWLFVGSQRYTFSKYHNHTAMNILLHTSWTTLATFLKNKSLMYNWWLNRYKDT